MRHGILEDTDLERNHQYDFACKKCGVMKLFVAAFISKGIHWQSDRHQGHFNKFGTKYYSQSNVFAITV